MKLVELLARNLEKWPDHAVYVTQDKSTRVNTYGDSLPVLSCDDKVQCVWTDVGFCGFIDDVCDALAHDCETAIITEAQWQAERDRQKGGEWKRHRGGVQPIEDGVSIEVRHRDGEIVATEAGSKGAIRWKHTGQPGDIMSYRVISQPQAEEIEVKDTTIGTLSYKVEIDTSAANQAIDELSAKWDQIETPFKWRDEVTELNAYIEKFTRERDALIELLASEGFALIPPVVSVISEFDGADMSDWRNWKAGDIVECVTGEYSGVYTKGSQYKVEWVKEDSFSVYDNHGGESSCDWFDHDAEGLKFVSRP